MSKKIQTLQERLSAVIEIVKEQFKPGARVAILVRNPSYENGDVWIGDASLEDIKHVLKLDVDSTAILIEGSKTEK